MKKYLAFLAVLLCLTSLGVSAQSNGTIAVTGRVVAPDDLTTTTKVVPETRVQSDGSTVTTYDVTSASTGEVLATFNSMEDAALFASQVNPAVAYRSY